MISKITNNMGLNILLNKYDVVHFHILEKVSDLPVIFRKQMETMCTNKTSKVSIITRSFIPGKKKKT